jgi:hypothetical protein
MKPYICNIGDCEASFGDPSSLRRHKRMVRHGGPAQTGFSRHSSSTSCTQSSSTVISSGLGTRKLVDYSESEDEGSQTLVDSESASQSSRGEGSSKRGGSDVSKAKKVLRTDWLDLLADMSLRRGPLPVPNTFEYP